MRASRASAGLYWWIMPAPTQSNTFPMGPASVHEWTESFGPLDVSGPSVSGPYDEAVASVTSNTRAAVGAGAAA